MTSLLIHAGLGLVTVILFFRFNAHLLLGGQVRGEPPDLYLIYPQGNPLGVTEDSPYLQMGAEIALHHHERWNSGGYPAGLKGERIPFSARIMNICDQYDALRSVRSYKKALPHDTVVEIITTGDGRTMPAHFDPEVVHAFKRSAKRFAEIFATMPD